MPRLNLSTNLQTVVVACLATLLINALLRIAGSEIRMLGFLSNYLFACAWFGLAIGCLNRRLRKIKVEETGWVGWSAAALVLLVVAHFTTVHDLGLLRDGSTYFVFPIFLDNYMHHELLMSVVMLVSFSAFVRCLIPFGEAVGRLSAEIAPGRLWVLFYLGALAGWAAFGLTLLVPWSAFAQVLLLAAGFTLIWRWRPRHLVALAVALTCCFLFDTIAEPGYVMEARAAHGDLFKNFWTPDGHVQTYPSFDGRSIDGLVVSNNHNIFQVICRPPADRGMEKRPMDMEDPIAGLTRAYYALPYAICPRPRKVLILGGGGGNEVAEALKHSPAHVDVVDSHPWVFELAARHPERPFDSPKVRKVVMDPRQYLKVAGERYDVIIFAAMESQSAFSPFGVLRPDNFIYTTEAFLDARDHMTPEGSLFVSYSSLRPWYSRRLVGNLLVGFNTIDALVRTHYRGYLVVSIAQNRLLSALLEQVMDPTRVGNVETLMKDAKDGFVTFDNWPFQFCVAPGLPRTNAFCLILLAAVVFGHLRPLLRDHPPENGGVGAAGAGPGNALSRLDWRLFTLSTAFGLSACKTVMTIGYNLGLTWDVALGAAASTAAAAALAGLPGRLRINVPAPLAWVLLFAAFAFDFCFNYLAVVSIPVPALRLAVSALLPMLPMIMVALLCWMTIRQSDRADVSMGVSFAGIFAGLLLAQGALLVGISNLDVTCMSLCAVALTMVLLPSGRGGGEKTEANHP